MTRFFTFALASAFAASMALAQQTQPSELEDQMQMNEEEAAAHLPPGEMTPQQQAIIDQLHTVDQALINKDFDSVSRWVSSSGVITNPNGQRLTRDVWLARLRSGELRYSSIERRDESVRLFGNAAVETCTLSLQGQDHGKDISGPYAFTSIWTQRDGQWQCVGAQLTPVSAMGEGR